MDGDPNVQCYDLTHYKILYLKDQTSFVNHAKPWGGDFTVQLFVDALSLTRE